MSDRLDPIFVLREIDALIAAYPDLEDDEQLRADMVEGSTGLPELLAKVVARMQDAQAKATGIDELVKLWRARVARFEQRIDAMRALAFKLMEHAAVRKIELPAATLSIRAGQPHVIITDEAALPEDCIRIKREPDKVTIKEYLARGEKVAGAEMSTAEPVLNVRVK